MTKKEIFKKALEMSMSENKYERERGEKALAYLANVNDDGRFGRADELLSALEKSNNTRVSKPGWGDKTLKFLKNGKVRYIRFERKSNGGRLEELIIPALQQQKVDYVVYSMDDVPVPQGKKAKAENRPVEYRNVEAVVIPKELFLAKLREFNAIKVVNRNGQFDGYGIQVTSKKWYEWLSEYPVIFERGYVYEDWMFEGLD